MERRDFRRGENGVFGPAAEADDVCAGGVERGGGVDDEADAEGAHGGSEGDRGNVGFLVWRGKN